MNEIICPNCKKPFIVEEAGFADILKQVRDQQFEEEILKRLALAEKEKEDAVKLAESNIKNRLQEQLAKKDQEITDLKAKKEIEMTQKLALKESELLQLKSKIENAEVEKKLAIAEATKMIEKERDDLVNSIKLKDVEKELLAKSLTDKYSLELREKDVIIKFKEDEISLRKDMKSKLSSKMIGETLEQHCETEFNKLRSTAFPNSYFEKDNLVIKGSKGDFIFREYDDKGNEIISIMFEMKNENEETATKKKTKIFLRNLIKIELKKNVSMPFLFLY